MIAQAHSCPVPSAVEFDAELVRRVDRAGPRYTSYPTADRFVEAFSDVAYMAWAARRHIGGARRPLALYVHLPFCRDVCFYCACNKIVTRNAGAAAQYLDYLGREIDLQSHLFRDEPRVIRMHWGGGTPTYYDTAALRSLFAHLAARFDLDPGGEYSIEIDPRSVDAAAMPALRETGFNRVSFGVQDFDPAVQAAVHRVQGEAETLAVIDSARRAGFDSVNIDLIYGLPRQTPAGFERTLARVTAARPDRIALYSYAHLPRRFKPQRRIREADLPAPEVKLQLLGLAIRRLADAGYVYIGMDHFALPGDALAVAQRQGRLGRDFQGYSVDAEADLVGLGVSAIGAIGPTYSQNQRTLPAYYETLDRGELPVARGIELAADDLLRRAVIRDLMCRFTVSRETIGAAYLIDFDRYFAAELDELRAYEALGLVSLDPGWITVTAKGRLLVRPICMVFDRYLRHERDAQRYSRVI